MTTHTITVQVVVDETHRNAVTRDDLVLAVENAVLTPDNAAYGIKDVVIDPDVINTPLFALARSWIDTSNDLFRFSDLKVRIILRDHGEKVLELIKGGK